MSIFLVVVESHLAVYELVDKVLPDRFRGL